MTIELRPFKDAPPCCSLVDVDGGVKWEDRGVWCRKTGRLVFDGRVAALECWEWEDVMQWARRVGVN